MISHAHAETAHAAADQAASHGGSLFSSPEFWVAVGIVLVVVLAARTVFRGITAGLDLRAQKIRDQIEESHQLREEAQKMLAEFNRKRDEAMQEVGEIAKTADVEINRLREKAKTDLENSLARRERQAEDRINHARQAATDAIRAEAIEIATAAATRALRDSLSAQKQNAMIDRAVSELPERLGTVH